MGSPLSGILADIFINHLENKFLSNDKSEGIILWNRFVDDIICIYDSNTTSAETLLNDLNNLHNSIKFTMETETNNKLNYLDITINRSDSNLSYSIYRKNTHTSHTIDANSNHPITHKLAGLKNMTHRALNTPLTLTEFEKEIKIIKQIAKENNFPTCTVDKLLNKKRTKKSLEPTQGGQKEKYVKFHFINNNTYKIANLFKSKGLKIAFKTNNSLQKHLHNSNINKQDKFSKSGVYQLNCQYPGCTVNYVGRTKRNFYTRYKEHRNAVRYNKYSAFCNHIFDNNHHFTNIETDLKILHYENKEKELNIKEAIEIHIAKNNNPLNINDHSLLRQSPLFSILNDNEHS